MYLLNTEKIKPGMILGRSLYNDRSELLLAAGYKITDDIILLLKRHGYNNVYINDGVVDYISPETTISDSLRMATGKAMVDAVDTLKSSSTVRGTHAMEKLDPDILKDKLSSDSKLKDFVRFAGIRARVENVLDEIRKKSKQIFAALPLKSDSGKDYEHAVDTTVLAVLLGIKFELNWKNLESLATSALLHDIGKAVIPEGRKIDQASFMREHPTYSMLLVKGAYPNDFMKPIIVQQHHETLDGKGYSLGIKGFNNPPNYMGKAHKSSISNSAMILAVANEYDNLYTGAKNGVRHTPDEALLTIAKSAGTKWNSHVVRALIKVVERYPVGSRVKIVSSEKQKLQGYIGVVAENNEKDPTKPLIILTHNPSGGSIIPIKLNLEHESRFKLEVLI